MKLLFIPKYSILYNLLINNNKSVVIIVIINYNSNNLQARPQKVGDIVVGVLIEYELGFFLRIMGSTFTQLTLNFFKTNTTLKTKISGVITVLA